MSDGDMDCGDKQIIGMRQSRNAFEELQFLPGEELTGDK